MVREPMLPPRDRGMLSSPAGPHRPLPGHMGDPTMLGFVRADADRCAGHPAGRLRLVPRVRIGSGSGLERLGRHSDARARLTIGSAIVSPPRSDLRSSVWMGRQRFGASPAYRRPLVTGSGWHPDRFVRSSSRFDERCVARRHRPDGVTACRRSTPTDRPAEPSPSGRSRSSSRAGGNDSASDVRLMSGYLARPSSSAAVSSSA